MKYFSLSVLLLGALTQQAYAVDPFDGINANDYTSLAAMQAVGWATTFEKHKMNGQGNVARCNPDGNNFYGWTDEQRPGNLTLTLPATGTGTVSFGNCFYQSQPNYNCVLSIGGVVKYSAGDETDMTVPIAFQVGDVLKLDDEGNAICKIMSIHLEPTPVEPPPVERMAGANGDPHFSTWQGEHFEYHGKCDLELVSDPTFADGKGLDVHIRTEIVRKWSYIKHAVIRIGDDVLQIEGGDVNENRYWFNKVYHGVLKTIGGFPLSYHKENEHQRSFIIDLTKGEQIRIKTYKEFVRVDFKHPKESFYGNTVGILGDFKTGKKLARDGFTVIEDNNDFGQEWQVLPTGPKLFVELEGPQLPEHTCVLPSELHAEEKRRRLGEATVTETMAELACAKVSFSERDACVFDVLTTDDVEMAGAY
jgi:hypothetical protein